MEKVFQRTATAVLPRGAVADSPIEFFPPIPRADSPQADALLFLNYVKSVPGKTTFRSVMRALLRGHWARMTCLITASLSRVRQDRPVLAQVDPPNGHGLSNAIHVAADVVRAGGRADPGC